MFKSMNLLPSVAMPEEVTETRIPPLNVVSDIALQQHQVPDNQYQKADSYQIIMKFDEDERKVDRLRLGSGMKKKTLTVSETVKISKKGP